MISCPSFLHLGTHPANLTLRFLLELSALFALGRWGWSGRDDGLRMLIGLGLPLAAAAAWGIFAVLRSDAIGLRADTGSRPPAIGVGIGLLLFRGSAPSMLSG